MTFLSFSTLHIYQKFINLQLQAQEFVLLLLFVVVVVVVVSQFRVRCLVSRLHQCPLSVTSFVLVIFICISYMFCSRVIYLFSCLVCGTYRNISCLGFHFYVFWFGHIRLVSVLCLLRFVVFQYFHSYIVSYFMLIHVFCNFVIFSYRVQQCVMSSLLNFR